MIYYQVIATNTNGETEATFTYRKRINAELIFDTVKEAWKHCKVEIVEVEKEEEKFF